MTKRILLALLAVLMCVSLCACGKSTPEKVADELKYTTWKCTSTLQGKDGYSTTSKYTYRFEDDTAYVDVDIDVDGAGWMSSLFSKNASYSGAYSVETNTITFYPLLEKDSKTGEYVVTEEDTMTIYYTYENNRLRLFLDEELTKEFK